MTLSGRSFLKELDFTPDEWRAYLDLSRELKAELRAGHRPKRLEGLTIALIFEKSSTRTRCAFEVAAAHEGATTTYLDPQSSQLGHKESVADTARVLGRMFDALEFRGTKQSDVELLAEHSGVPVFNGLTDEWHPTQMLADALTISEHVDKPLAETAHAFVGDARFNMGRSTLISNALLGMDVRMIAPPGYEPPGDVIDQARTIAETTGARITITDDVAAIEGADAVSTDVWVSMGEAASVWEERINALFPYQVNAELMAATGNPDSIFLHCLPAFHDLETSVGRNIHERFGLSALEVTDDVFHSPNSHIFDQAENRLHTIKAVMVAAFL